VSEDLKSSKQRSWSYMKLPPLDVIATWPKPNYDNPITQGPASIIVNNVFFAFATILVVLRLYTRLIIKKCFGWDDFFIILAYVFFSSN
jgi:hypothetical protein